MKKLMFLMVIICNVSFASESLSGCSEVREASRRERGDTVDWCLSRDYSYYETIRSYEVCVYPDGEACGYSEYLTFRADISCLKNSSKRHKVRGLCD